MTNRIIDDNSSDTDVELNVTSDNVSVQNASSFGKDISSRELSLFNEVKSNSNTEPTLLQLAAKQRPRNKAGVFIKKVKSVQSSLVNKRKSVTFGPVTRIKRKYVYKSKVANGNVTSSTATASTATATASTATANASTATANTSTATANASTATANASTVDVPVTTPDVLSIIQHKVSSSDVAKNRSFTVNEINYDTLQNSFRRKNNKECFNMCKKWNNDIVSFLNIYNHEMLFFNACITSNIVIINLVLKHLMGEKIELVYDNFIPIVDKPILEQYVVLALRSGYIKLIKYLFPIHPVKNALLYAGESGNKELIDYLCFIERTTDFSQVFSGLAKGGHVGLMKIFIEKRISHFTIAQSYAIQEGEIETIEFLKHSLNVRLLNTGLYDSCRFQNIEMIKYFIKKGATNLEQVMKYGLENNYYESVAVINYYIHNPLHHPSPSVCPVHHPSPSVCPVHTITNNDTTNTNNPIDIEKIKLNVIGTVSISNILKYMIQHASLHDVIHLIGNQTISECNMVLLYSAKYGKNDMFTHYLNKNGTNFDSALKVAGEYNRSDMIKQLLLKRGCNHTLIMYWAQTHNNTELINHMKTRYFFSDSIIPYQEGYRFQFDD